ncbi:uncharacterized protein V6R79_012104 [Siganus canaliculatus]
MSPALQRAVGGDSVRHVSSFMARPYEVKDETKRPIGRTQKSLLVMLRGSEAKRLGKSAETLLDSMLNPLYCLIDGVLHTFTGRWCRKNRSLQFLGHAVKVHSIDVTKTVK